MLQVHKQEMVIQDNMIKLLEEKVAQLERNTKPVNCEESTILSADSRFQMKVIMKKILQVVLIHCLDQHKGS